MSTEYKVLITETVSRNLWVTASSPLEAQRIAEEDYYDCGEPDVAEVNIEVDPTSRRYLWERERGYEPEE